MSTVSMSVLVAGSPEVMRAHDNGDYHVVPGGGLARDLARRGLLVDEQSAPHAARDDQIQAVGRHATAGASVGVEQDLVIKGQMTPSAMRPRHPAPRHRAACAGGHGGGRVIPRHHGSKAAPIDGIQHRHDSAALRTGDAGCARSRPSAASPLDHPRHESEIWSHASDAGDDLNGQVSGSN